MLNRISSTLFNAVAMVAAATAVVWLAITGHAWQVEGLLLVMGAILGMVVFGFRLNEGPGVDYPSFWAGPVGALRRSPITRAGTPATIA